MANPLKGETTLRVGEVDHRLVINWDVLIQVERDCGLPLLLPNLWQHLGFLTSLLRHALVAGGGRMISSQEAAAMMARSDDVLKVMHATYLAIMPETGSDDDAGKGEPEGNGSRPRPTTGTRSSPTGAKRAARRRNSG